MKFNTYIEEHWPIKQQARIVEIDQHILGIEAALLGIQSDGSTNSSELIKSLRQFKQLWELEKQQIGGRMGQ